MAAEKKTSPNVESRLRHNILKMPQEVYAASGIVINGRRLKSFVFTTDLAIIRNCDADAVFAVYPFTPQQAISDAIIKASYIPVFCGVGGGTTHGVRTLNLARDVESQGAMGVVLNSPISDLNLLAVSRVVDIPVIITVTKEDTNIRSRIEAGASILNVACSTDTPRIVKKIRDEFPDVPIIASGGKTGETISATIAAGANAITYTPPSPEAAGDVEIGAQSGIPLQPVFVVGLQPVDAAILEGEEGHGAVDLVIIFEAADLVILVQAVLQLRLQLIVGLVADAKDVHAVIFQLPAELPVVRREVRGDKDKIAHGLVDSSLFSLKYKAYNTPPADTTSSSHG